MLKQCDSLDDKWSPYSLVYKMPVPQLVVLFGEFVKTLGGGDLREEVPLNMDFDSLCSYYTLSLFSLLPASEWRCDL